MQKAIIALAISFLTTGPVQALEHKVLACNIDNLFVREGDRTRPSISDQKAFVVKWYFARVEGKKPFRMYHTAALDVDLHFTAVRGFRKVVHQFNGADFIGEFQAPDLFKDGAQVEYLDDKRVKSAEEAVKDIRIEGSYVSGGSTFLLNRKNDKIYEYSASFFERQDGGKSRLVAVMGSCSLEN